MRHPALVDTISALLVALLLLCLYTPPSRGRAAPPPPTRDPLFRVETLYRPEDEFCGEDSVVDMNDFVSVHLNVTDADTGELISATYQYGEPLTFYMNQNRIFPGLKEGVLGACKGEIRHLYVPPSMAFVHMGAGGLVDTEATVNVTLVLVHLFKR